MIKAPNWCKTAQPTVKGWVDAKSGELMKSQKFTAKQVSEWHDALHGIGNKRKVAEVVVDHVEAIEEEIEEIEDDEEVD